MRPQWSPVFATGVTAQKRSSSAAADRPQWSPVFATGVTKSASNASSAPSPAAMEPGLRDRGHPTLNREPVAWQVEAAMEPGLRDRGHRQRARIDDLAWQ